MKLHFPQFLSSRCEYADKPLLCKLYDKKSFNCNNKYGENCAKHRTITRHIKEAQPCV